MNKPNYRFEFKIVDTENDQIVTSGSTFLSTINADGECESVDMEVASSLRAFKKKFQAIHEASFYPSLNCLHVCSNPGCSEDGCNCDCGDIHKE